MRESRTYGSVRGACDETHVPAATPPPVHPAARRRGCVIVCMVIRGIDPSAEQAPADHLSRGKRAHAQRKVHAFIEGMRALGYAEGRDFEIEYRWAEGYLERLPALAEESVRRGSDVIVVANPQSAVVAKDATKTIPIVSAMLDDPVGLGLIKSDAKPGGNVTGLLASLPGLHAKQLELAREIGRAHV